MNGVHDLGGMDGFGSVQVEEHEPVFHHAWERRVFGMTFAAAAQRLSNTDAFRHAIERMEPTHYLGSSYYEHWLTGLATLLVERGVLTRAELVTRAGAAFLLSQPVRAGTLSVPSSSDTASRFAVGNTVRVRNRHPAGHTRCPRYVRGKRGVVTRIDGRFALPDVAAHSEQRCIQFSYNVRFDGAELWGESAGGAEAVYVDLWDEYLEVP
jgi:nitrile hydratase subunit beta